MTAGPSASYKTEADDDYVKGFEKAGVAKVHDPKDAVAARVQDSVVRVALLAALDDWAVCTSDPDLRDWLLAVARKADPDAWRDRARDPATWEDATALAALASSTSIADEPVSLELALAERLANAKGDSLSFLRQIAHPADFWDNMTLGTEFMRHANKANEAAGYFRAALGSRPHAPVAYNAVGDAMRRQRRLEEAIVYYERAIELDGQYARAHTNLGITFWASGNHDLAMECFQRAIDADSSYAVAHFELANLLTERNRLDEALAHYQRVLALDPEHPAALDRLQQTLLRQGRTRDASLLNAP